MTPADVVTEVLGVRPLARELGLSPSTVAKWKKRYQGRIPSEHHLRILELADGKISADDLVYGR